MNLQVFPAYLCKDLPYIASKQTHAQTTIHTHRYMLLYLGSHCFIQDSLNILEVLHFFPAFLEFIFYYEPGYSKTVRSYYLPRYFRLIFLFSNEGKFSLLGCRTTKVLGQIAWDNNHYYFFTCFVPIK